MSRHRDHFLDLRRRVVALEFHTFMAAGLGDAHDGIDVLLMAAGETREDRIRGEAVLDITRLEGIEMAAEDVAEVVGVRAVGEHVGNFELGATLGVGVSGHDHGDLFPAQVVGARLAAPDALHFPLGVAEADEALEKLGIGVLDVIHIDHHVVAHLQCEVEFIDLLAG